MHACSGPSDACYTIMAIHALFFAVEIPDVQSTGLSDGAIAGIVIGVVVAAIAIILVIVIVLVYIMYSHGKKQPEAKDTNEQ